MWNDIIYIGNHGIFFFIYHHLTTPSTTPVARPGSLARALRQNHPHIDGNEFIFDEQNTYKNWAEKSCNPRKIKPGTTLHIAQIKHFLQNISRGFALLPFFFVLCVLFLAIFQWYEHNWVRQSLVRWKNTARMNDKSTQQKEWWKIARRTEFAAVENEKKFFFSSHFLSFAVSFAILFARDSQPFFLPLLPHRQSISLRHFPIRKWYYPPQEAANGKDVNDATSRYSMSDGGGRSNNAES